MPGAADRESGTNGDERKDKDYLVYRIVKANELVKSHKARPFCTRRVLPSWGAARLPLLLAQIIHEFVGRNEQLVMPAELRSLDRRMNNVPDVGSAERQLRCSGNGLRDIGLIL